MLNIWQFLFFILSSDTEELLGTVAELKHSHRRLRDQNCSLIRTVAQCEDANLQLAVEVTELRAKLARWFWNMHSILAVFVQK